MKKVTWTEEEFEAAYAASNSSGSLTQAQAWVGARVLRAGQSLDWHGHRAVRPQHNRKSTEGHLPFGGHHSSKVKAQSYIEI